MKRTTIDLAGPFEEIAAKLSTLPPTDSLVRRNASSELSPEVQEVLRRIYEAARGRQIETVIGLVPVGAPAMAPFLKDAPFEVGSQADFLLQALARLYRGRSSRKSIPSPRIDKEIGYPKAESRRPSGHQQQRIFHAIR